MGDRFADLPTHLDLLLGQVKSESYSDEKIENIAGMNIKKLSNEALTSVARKFLQDLSTGRVTGATVRNAIKLAFHLRSTKDINQCIFESYFYTGNESSDTEDITEDVQQLTLAPVTVDLNYLAAASFLAAYSLRLIVKTEANMNHSWSNMTGRYYGFYGGRYFSLNEIPTATWKAFKMFLPSYGKVQITWVKLIANAEVNKDIGTKDQGLIRYIGAMVFEYSGMHAYSLTLRAQKYTKMSFKEFLAALTTRQTANALAVIQDIHCHHDTTTEDNRSKYFKYARLLGPQFFVPLQTKKCPQLVYLLVMLLKKYEAFGDNSDPSKIAHLDNLPKYATTFYSQFADSLYESNQG